MRTLAVLATCAATLACAPKETASVKDLKTSTEKVSYIIGLQMGKSLKQQGVEVTPALLVQGLADGSSGGKALLTDEEIQTTMAQFQVEMMGKQKVKDSVASIDNKKAGEDFLVANKSKPGVVTTASGLQYKVLKQGTGPKPTGASTVTVHYRGTTLDGNEFDSSYKRNEPATFPLRGVIPGWTEGLQLMPVGSKYEFYIPSDLAYGPAGSPPNIGPNSTLVFEVELLAVK